MFTPVCVSNAYLLFYTGTSVNVNLLSAFTAQYGAPTRAVDFKVTVGVGVVIGGTPGNYAVTLGQFPTGSKIQLDNFGSIQGHYGAANSGQGGPCIYADYANQKVTINNMAGASIYAGGGGGGAGGTGGTAGAGGGGYYQNYNWVGELFSGYVQNQVTCDVNAGCRIRFGDGVLCYTPNGSGCTDYGEWPISNLTPYCTSCYYLTTTYTGGGAGGGGGSGGSGGNGIGYGVAAAGGAAGAGGYGGGAPGTNAGWGGTGGSGGYGGTGGSWGAYGGGGATGNTGGTGGNGNNGGGAGGASGAGGAGGGAPGYYIIKGASNVVLNNSGSLAGWAA